LKKVGGTFQQSDVGIVAGLSDEPSVDTVVKANNKNDGENDDGENAV
jgi:hypothetical protein